MRSRALEGEGHRWESSDESYHSLGTPGKRTRSGCFDEGAAPDGEATHLSGEGGSARVDDWQMTPALSSAMGFVQRKERSQDATESATGNSLSETNDSSGRPLPDDLRAKMEAAFGVDFSAVRVHEGPQAESLGARAYTRGTEIVFAPGEYQPESQAGQELLGHELAHVVQQSQGRAQPRPQAKRSHILVDDALEREADKLGARAARGKSTEQTSTATTLRSDAASPIQRRELPNKARVSTGDWRESDREDSTQIWKDACLCNLLAGDFRQYVRIIERRDFYRWFYEHTAALGYTTRWALAASIVATGAHEVAHMNPGLESMGQMTGTISNELQGMMREGNQVIFDNVFPKLRALFLGGPLTGRDALRWDMRILSEEQSLIQPLYMGVSSETRAQLDRIARQRGLPGAMSAVMAPTVEPSQHSRSGDIPPFTAGAMTSVDDRWRYGMNLGDRFTPNGTGFDPTLDSRPAPGSGYADGTELAKVQTRHHLHRLDAALDGGASGARWLTEEIERIVRGLSGNELEELLGDRRPDGGRYSHRLHLPRATMLQLLATWRIGLEEQMNFLEGSIGGHNDGRWRELEYSWIAPIIRPFDQAQKSRLHTAKWKRIFLMICDDDTIADAVNDLGLPEPLRSQWLEAERSWF